LLASFDYPWSGRHPGAGAQRAADSRATTGAHDHQSIDAELAVTETTETVTWLTQEAYDRLKAELDHLSGEGRLEISRRIEQAREEGDLRENGGYHAAKEEQGKQEARIRQLEQLLRHAKVGEAPAAAEGVVAPGMVVTVRFAGDDEDSTFLLGSREDTGTDLDVYSPQSPLGSAVNGKKAGETVEYATPSGAKVEVAIVNATPFAR
jgi:transcription elongation factor GreA